MRSTWHLSGSAEPLCRFRPKRSREAPRGRDIAAVLLAIATAALVALDISLDQASKLFALLFAGIAALMIVYSAGYMAGTECASRYYFFACVMTGSLTGLTKAHEFSNFYGFWELMTWTSYFLVAHEQTPEALRAGLVYFLTCAAGAYIMHFGILLVLAPVSIRRKTTEELCQPQASVGRVWRDNEQCKAWPTATAAGGEGLTFLVIPPFSLPWLRRQIVAEANVMPTFFIPAFMYGFRPAFTAGAHANWLVRVHRAGG